MRTLLTTAGVCAAAWAALVALLWLLQDRVLFHPAPNHPAALQLLQGRDWSFARDGSTQHGWWLPAAETRRAPLLLYFGGNAEDAAGAALRVRAQLPGVNLLVLNYRGYGLSAGRPSVQALMADGIALYDTAVPELPHDGRVLVMGRSLGSGVASAVAAARPVAGVLLVTPFDSLRAVAAAQLPWVPAARLLHQDMDNAALAQGIDAPVLVLTAGRDRVIPPVHAQALADRWSGPVTVRHWPQAGHNDIDLAPGFATALQKFVAGLR